MTVSTPAVAPAALKSVATDAAAGPAAAPPAPAPAPAGATPFQKALDALIGQKALKLDFGDIQTRDTYIANIGGARDGYETLDAALSYAMETAEKNFNYDPYRPAGTTGTPFIIVRAADRYALVQPDSLLMTVAGSRLYRANGYRWHGTDAGKSIAAVVDGAGNVLPNLGQKHWWS